MSYRKHDKTGLGNEKYLFDNKKYQPSIKHRMFKRQAL